MVEGKYVVMKVSKTRISLRYGDETLPNAKRKQYPSILHNRFVLFR